jgi:hypothetical protein
VDGMPDFLKLGHLILRYEDFELFEGLILHVRKGYITRN